MFELEMNGQVYQFNFGMGFLREANKRIKRPLDGIKNADEGVGLRYMIGGIIDGNVEDLVDALYIANKGQSPRVTMQLLDEYIDDPSTDIDKLFDEVTDFLSSANATKKETKKILDMAEKQKAIQEKLQELTK